MSKLSKLPKLHAEVFDCPHCKCTTKHYWYFLSGKNGKLSFLTWMMHNSRPKMVSNQVDPDGYIATETSIKVEKDKMEGNWELGISVCSICKQYVLWRDGNIIYPNKHGVDDPNPDMPEAVSVLYNEARSIVQLSPKSACALLRLGLEKLLVHLKCPEKNNIYNNIKLLKERDNINDVVFDALNAVRLVGNNAVHPGKINIDDDPKIAGTLFWLLNFIVEELISKPAKVSEFKKSLF
ncbi:hypothetical protein CON95_12610 [Bacillus toyonensis]|uniref:DUF4145 domain-containing protein n=1 Tax=Bacillus toyonensis TaxID=155322 RepID=UPI000BEC6557|nr:DUF4145 domain-containing protein [Bacillus toyonensis]PEE23012.1 hypothetical protein CON95_12610 [Bacillus toyonensis]